MDRGWRRVRQRNRSAGGPPRVQSVRYQPRTMPNSIRPTS